jgi:hypothetical protein
MRCSSAKCAGALSVVKRRGFPITIATSALPQVALHQKKPKSAHKKPPKKTIIVEFLVTALLLL